MQATLDKSIYAQQPDYSESACIWLPIPKQVVVRLQETLRDKLPTSALETAHITLVYLKKPPVSTILTVQRLLAYQAATLTTTRVAINGLATFSRGDDGWPIVVLVDSPGLLSIYCSLRDALRSAKVDFAENYGFTPHITLDYVQSLRGLPLTALPKMSWAVKRFELVRGNKTLTSYKIGTSGD